MADIPDITETFLQIDLALADMFVGWTQYCEHEHIEMTDGQRHQLYNYFRMAFCEGEMRLWAKCAPLLLGEEPTPGA